MPAGSGNDDFVWLPTRQFCSFRRAGRRGSHLGAQSSGGRQPPAPAAAPLFRSVFVEPRHSNNFQRSGLWYRFIYTQSPCVQAIWPPHPLRRHRRSGVSPLTISQWAICWAKALMPKFVTFFLLRILINSRISLLKDACAFFDRSLCIFAISATLYFCKPGEPRRSDFYRRRVRNQVRRQAFRDTAQ